MEPEAYPVCSLALTESFSVLIGLAIERGDAIETIINSRHRVLSCAINVCKVIERNTAIGEDGG